MKYKLSLIPIFTAILFMSLSADKPEKTPEICVQLGHSHLVSSAAFSPDGKYALSGAYDETVKLWEISSGKEIRTFQGHSGTVNSVTFSPDGKYALSGSKDESLKLWEISTGREIITFKGHESAVFSIAFSPDGKYALSGSRDESLKLWEISTGKDIRTFQGHSDTVFSIAFSPDGKYALSGSVDKTLKLWDTNTGKEIRTFKGHSDWIMSAAFSPDGKYALSGADDKTLKLWEINTGREIKTFQGHTEWVMSAVFSPDGKYALSGSFDKTLKLWEISAGKEIRTFKGHSDGIYTAAFSPDGKYALSGSADKTLKLWEISTGREIKTFQGHSKTVRSAAFCPDGQYALSGSDDQTIKLWDINTGKEIKTFQRHSDGIYTASFSPDGKYALSGSGDNTMRIYNISDSSWTAFISGKAGTADEGKWLVWTNDGYWDSSPDGGDLVAMVRGMEVWNIDQFAVKNNRPDIIAQRLGADKETIDHFYAHYLKRLKKLKITEDKLADDYYVPTAEINEAKQNDKIIDIKFTLTDLKYKLTRYNIFVNDVPLFGSYGKEISGNNQALSEKIELTSGDNKIEISCMNENGAESFRALTIAVYDKPVKPDLYYIGFGVSDYKNNIPSELETADYEEILKSDLLKEAKAFIQNAYIKDGKKYKIRGNINKNDYDSLKEIFDKLNISPVINDLNYAHKDALDLAELLKSRKDNYANIYTYAFVNEQATVDNIKKAKDLLKTAKPDDTLVLFIAGHGLHDIDKEATYYFLTHEADLTNLPGTAANFELIEDILQGIPPRNKLFLMDTCESGEIELDMSDLRVKLEKDKRSIKARAIDNRGLKPVKEEKKVRTCLFDKDRYIYNDLARRSGAIVFSSCKGGEFSYEDQSTQNGFFTFKIKEVLNKEKTIPIDKLKTEVIKEVAEMSDGLQNPTVDRDNIYQKFGL